MLLPAAVGGNQLIASRQHRNFDAPPDGNMRRATRGKDGYMPSVDQRSRFDNLCAFADIFARVSNIESNLRGTLNPDLRFAFGRFFFHDNRGDAIRDGSAGQEAYPLA